MMIQKFKYWIRAYICVLFIFTFTIPASAALLEVSFTGSITSVPMGVASAFTVGDSVSGSYFIDSNTADSDPDAGIGLYIGPTDFTYQFGSYLATAGGGSGGDSVLVANEAADRFQTNAVGPSGADVNGYSLTNLNLQLIDNSGTVFDNDALPAGLNIADFDLAIASLIFQQPNFSSPNVIADLSSINISVVPVPAAVWLFGTALIGFFGMARRRKLS